MPIWLISLITGLSLFTAFKCPACQEWNRPSKPEIGHVVKAIRDTPVYNSHKEDTLQLMLIRNAHEYYRLIYRDIVRCSGLQDDLAYEELNFYVSDFAQMDINSEQVIAYYEPISGSIILSLSGVWSNKVVGHELLHMLLQKYGLQDPTNKNEDQHPAYWFNDVRKCKGIVFPH